MNKYYTVEIENDATVRINKKEWDEFIKFRSQNKASSAEARKKIESIAKKHGITVRDLGPISGSLNEDKRRKIKAASKEAYFALYSLGLEGVSKIMGISISGLHKRVVSL